MLMVGSMNYWQPRLGTLATLIMFKSKASKLFGGKLESICSSRTKYVKGTGVAIVKVAIAR